MIFVFTVRYVLAFLLCALTLRCADHFPDSYATPPLARDFALSDGARVVRLSDLVGPGQAHVVLLYFGYASCPDICPRSMQLLARTVESLEVGERARLRVVFISTDPERDTPARAAGYARSFHPDFLGLAGSRAETGELLSAYGILSHEREDPEHSGRFLIDHSSAVLWLDGERRLRKRIPGVFDPADLAADLRRAL